MAEIPSCSCETSEIRLRMDSLGRSHYVQQCLTCGREMGRVKKSTMGAPSTAFDESLRDQWQERLTYAYAERAAEREEERREWEADRPLRVMAYAEYLKTEHWQKIREVALARDGYHCQICGKWANVVHHLTYAHRGNEHLFELVSLCHACHDEYHPDGTAGHE